MSQACQEKRYSHLLTKSHIYQQSPPLSETDRPMPKPTSVRLPSSAKLSTLSIRLLRCGSFICAARGLNNNKTCKLMTNDVKFVPLKTNRNLQVLDSNSQKYI